MNDVVIPDGVTTLGESSFYDCPKLQKINIPASVKTINTTAFSGCVALQNIEFAPNSSLNTLGNSCFAYTNLHEINLDAPIATFGEKTFTGCTNLTKASISDKCLATSLGNQCFMGCTNLTEVHLPKYLTDLAASTFDNCKNLQEVRVPSKVRTLGMSCFNGCEALVSVELSKSLQTISMHCFDGCLALKTLSIPASVTSIGSFAFMNSGIEDLDISEGLSNIGNYTFDYCANLKSVKLPSTLETVGTDFLGSSDNLTEVICLAVEPPTYTPIFVYYPMISNNVAANATLYVPSESIQKYKEDKNWGVFYKIEPYTGANGIANTEMASVKIEVSNGSVSISGLSNGTQVLAYSIDGKLLTMATVSNRTVSLNTGSGVIALRIGKETVKLLIK